MNSTTASLLNEIYAALSYGHAAASQLTRDARGVTAYEDTKFREQRIKRGLEAYEKLSRIIKEQP